MPKAFPNPFLVIRPTNAMHYLCHVHTTGPATTGIKFKNKNITQNLSQLTVGITLSCERM